MKVKSSKGPTITVHFRHTVRFTGETLTQFGHLAERKSKQVIDASGQTDLPYDGLGRLQCKTAPAGKVTYAYADTFAKGFPATHPAKGCSSNSSVF